MHETVRLVLLSLCLVALLTTGCGQQARQESKPRIGVVNLNPQLESVVSGFRQSLQQRGYEDGVDVDYLYAGPLRDIRQVEAELARLIDSEVDLLLTLTTPVTRLAKKATRGTKIPVLFAPVFSPVESGIVNSLIEPGANVTGVKIRGSTGKALEWLLLIDPSIKRLFVPLHQTDKAALHTLDDLEVAASTLGVELVVEAISTSEELLEELAAMPMDVDAIWLTHSHLIVSHVRDIVETANSRRIPTASSASQYRNGILVSFSSEHIRLGAQASMMAVKLLKGVPAATMPVETASYYLGINIKTAHLIGLQVSPDILSQADYIVR